MSVGIAVDIVGVEVAIRPHVPSGDGVVVRERRSLRP